MAGTATAAIPSVGKKREGDARVQQISAVSDAWRVEYARFVDCQYQSSAFTSTHPSLMPLKRNRIRSSWISTAAAEAASVQLIYEKTSSGADDAVLVLSLRSKSLVSLGISSFCLNFLLKVNRLCRWFLVHCCLLCCAGMRSI